MKSISDFREDAQDIHVTQFSVGFWPPKLFMAYWIRCGPRMVNQVLSSHNSLGDELPGLSIHDIVCPRMHSQNPQNCPDSWLSTVDLHEFHFLQHHVKPILVVSLTGGILPPSGSFNLFTMLHTWLVALTSYPSAQTYGFYVDSSKISWWNLIHSLEKVFLFSFCICRTGEDITKDRIKKKMRRHGFTATFSSIPLWYGESSWAKMYFSWKQNFFTLMSRHDDCGERNCARVLVREEAGESPPKMREGVRG